MPKNNTPIGRLAMRHEGDFWNAYYALPNSMEGAILLGSIAMRFVTRKKRKDAFMELMKEAVADIIEETTGDRPAWPEKPRAAIPRPLRVEYDAAWKEADKSDKRATDGLEVPVSVYQRVTTAFENCKRAAMEAALRCAP